MRRPAGWTSRWVTNERTGEGRVKTSSDAIVCAWELADNEYNDVRSRFRASPDQAQSGRTRETDMEDRPRGADALPLPLPVELEPAYGAMESENYSAALTMARAHCMHPADNVRADAYRLCALSLARMERWAESFADYHEVFEIESSAFAALQLACTSVMDGQLLRGEAWLQRAIQINQQTRELPPPRLRTNYLSALEQAGEWSACRPHLDWLANSYRAMQPLDSHRLFMADMPQLGEFLRKSRGILGEAVAPAELRDWYLALREGLDEGSREAIDQHIARLT